MRDGDGVRGREQRKNLRQRLNIKASAFLCVKERAALKSKMRVMCLNKKNGGQVAAACLYLGI